MFVAITGPAGIGKSTVGEKLAKTMERACHVDLDAIKHFVVIGFIYDETESGLEQWKLLGRNAALIVTNFLDSGYSVVVSGMVNENTWQEIFKTNQATLKVLLIASREVNIGRDASRNAEVQMGLDIVNEHQDYFAKARDGYFFNDFQVVDTSGHNEDESVNSIISLLKSK